MIPELHLITVKDFCDPHQLWLRVSPDGISFNSKASQKLNLNDYSSIRFYSDTSDSTKMGKMFMEPNREAKSRSNWRFTVDRTRLKRRNISSRFAPCRPFVDSNPRLKKISQSPLNYQRRLQIDFDENLKMYYSVVSPCFEKTTNIEKTLPSIPVIYALFRKDGICVDIGETNSLKRRMKEHIRDQWDFFKIDYSEIENTEERKSWESYHLDQYRAEHSSLPFYNRQGGKNFGNIISINNGEDSKPKPNGLDPMEEMLPKEGEVQQ